MLRTFDLLSPSFASSAAFWRASRSAAPEMVSSPRACGSSSSLATTPALSLLTMGRAETTATEERMETTTAEKRILVVVVVVGGW